MNTNTTVHEPLSGAEARAQQIKMRRLEIFAELSEMRRAFIVDGVERPYAVRVTLEAEYAALELEARVISVAASKAGVARRKQQAESLLQQLKAVLQESGLNDVWQEANRRSEAALLGLERT